MSRVVDVRVPDMGNFKDVAIIDVLVKAGDAVEVETPLITLETEKATMDVPSTVSGVIERVTVSKGGQVNAGDVVVAVRTEAEDGAAAGGADPTSAAQQTSGAQSASATQTTSGSASVTGSAAAAQTASAARSASGAQSASATQPAASGSGRGASAGGASVGGSAVAGAPAAAQQASGSSGEAGRSLSPGHSSSASLSSSGSAAASAAPAGAKAGPAAAASVTAASAPTVASEQAAASAQAVERGFSEAHASPSVRKLARELGVPLGSVQGTGFKGRITEIDLKAFVKKTLEAGAAGPGGAGRAAGAGGRGGGATQGLPSVPVVDFAQFGPTEVKPLSRIQRISGARLHASWVNIPHVTQFDEADITALEALRAELKDRAASRGIKLTPLAFILRACVKALQEFPQFNSSLDPSGESLIFRKYVHIGFAADTPNGLLVPVVRDADRKDIYELARAASELAGKARAGTLTLAEMQGGCFTVSSLGGIGGTAFTPIINAPEVAILGVSRSSLKPVFIDGAFLPRLTLPLSLSYDHRVIDGALAVRFTTFLSHALADARGLAEAVP